MPAIIDAHLDLAINALGVNRDLRLPLPELNAREEQMSDHRMRGKATVSLPEMRRGRVRLCCATVLARARSDRFPPEGFSRLDIDFSAPEIASAYAVGQLNYYDQLAATKDICYVRDQSELTSFWATGEANPQAPLGIILAMEGADPIVSPEALEWWWDRGLRVASLVHYGQGPYAAGTGVEGGVTKEGLALLEAFKRVGMILDVTHLADRAFDEAIDSYSGPIVASHNNCRSLVPGQRQFTDRQICELGRLGAVIGVACDAWMLYPGWERGKTKPEVVGMDAIVDHIDHICQVTGAVDHAGIGSDLDGLYGNNQTPHDLRTIADLQRLSDLLASRGYSNDDIEAVLWKNWFDFFNTHLPSSRA